MGGHFGRLGSWTCLEEWATLLNPQHPFALLQSLHALPLCVAHCDWLMGVLRLHYTDSALDITQRGSASAVFNAPWQDFPVIPCEPLYFRDFWASTPLQTQQTKAEHNRPITAHSSEAILTPAGHSLQEQLPN